MAGDALLSLEYTPTYAVATVVTVIVAGSLVMERSLHHLKKWLHDSGRKPLSNAVELVQEELMLLGFISLLLTIFQNNIGQICVPSFENSSMLPCRYKTEEKSSYPEPPTSESSTLTPEAASHGRRLLSFLSSTSVQQLESAGAPELLRRMLAEAASNPCGNGKQPFVSSVGIHQLHIFIFLLAIVHICYSGITMLLAIYKIHRWHSWEVDAENLMEQCANMTAPERLKLMHKASSFVERHTKTTISIIPLEQKKSWWKCGFQENLTDEEEEKTTSLLLWVICFFRQFGRSVSRTDYLTLRMAFITNHNAELKFDFHRYLIRSMEVDFIHIVGTSISLWVWVVLILLLNINGWNIFFWIDIIPVVLALVIGTKLQHVMATLAFEGRKIGGLCIGAHIKARDALFWFKNPRILVYILHFIIFQNSFELSIYFWYLWEFGNDSCLLTNDGFIYTRLALSVAVQFLCSYITLPLYCLVTQMGSNFKHTIFEEHLNVKLKAWAQRHKKQKAPLNAVDVSDKIQSTVTESAKAVTKTTKKFTDVVRTAVMGQNVGDSNGIERVVDINTVDIGPGSEVNRHNRNEEWMRDERNQRNGRNVKTGTKKEGDEIYSEDDSDSDRD